ncbi:hypothetical protein QUA13_24285 [Microcoleus sp. S28C3]|uniref:hypothetical protein n=1 Tax=Microcoleus sp. S28C3 TaxID=3055414 RepID=UPI002FD1E715
MEEQNGELLKLHERIGDLWLKVPSLKEQLEIEYADRQQVAAQLTSTREELDRTRVELASKCEEVEKLKENPPGAIEQNPAPAIDLPEQIAEIVNFLKELLPPDTKWPKRVIPSLRKFLESKEE